MNVSEVKRKLTRFASEVNGRMPCFLSFKAIVRYLPERPKGVITSFSIPLSSELVKVQSLIFLHERLHILRMVRYALASNESATVLRYEHIVFNSYASKVLVGLNLIKIEEFCTVT